MNTENKKKHPFQKMAEKSIMLNEQRKKFLQEHPEENNNSIYIPKFNLK